MPEIVPNDVLSEEFHQPESFVESEADLRLENFESIKKPQIPSEDWEAGLGHWAVIIAILVGIFWFARRSSRSSPSSGSIGGKSDTSRQPDAAELRRKRLEALSKSASNPCATVSGETLAASTEGLRQRTGPTGSSSIQPTGSSSEIRAEAQKTNSSNAELLETPVVAHSSQVLKKTEEKVSAKSTSTQHNPSESIVGTSLREGTGFSAPSESSVSVKKDEVAASQEGTSAPTKEHKVERSEVQTCALSEAESLLPKSSPVVMDSASVTERRAQKQESEVVQVTPSLEKTSVVGVTEVAETTASVQQVQTSASGSTKTDTDLLPFWVRAQGTLQGNVKAEKIEDLNGAMNVLDLETSIAKAFGSGEEVRYRLFYMGRELKDSAQRLDAVGLKAGATVTITVSTSTAPRHPTPKQAVQPCRDDIPGAPNSTTPPNVPESGSASATPTPEPAIPPTHIPAQVETATPTTTLTASPADAWQAVLELEQQLNRANNDSEAPEVRQASATLRSLLEAVVRDSNPMLLQSVQLMVPTLAIIWNFGPTRDYLVGMLSTSGTSEGTGASNNCAETEAQSA